MKYPRLIHWSGVNSPGASFCWMHQYIPRHLMYVTTAPCRVALKALYVLYLYRYSRLILVITLLRTAQLLTSPIAPHHVSVSPTVNMNSKLHSGRSRIRSLEDCLST